MDMNKNKHKILFIYEKMQPPYDEGMKNTANKVYTTLKKYHNVTLMEDHSYLSHHLNSFWLVPRIVLCQLFHHFDKIIYIPHSSLTQLTLMKVFTLNFLLGKKLSVIGLQERQITSVMKLMLKTIKRAKIFVLSKQIQQSMLSFGAEVSIFPIGVDTDKFKPIKDDKNLRAKYGLDPNLLTILHVGHIKNTRNLLWLVKLKKDIENIQVVCVGSTTTKHQFNERDIQLRKDMENAGIHIIQHFVAENEQLYQFSDIYCFPVLIKKGAMETPLSIFEAMSVNLPIVTTPFGSLPDLIEESKFIKFVETYEEFRDAIKQESLSGPCNNREQALKFSWEHTAKVLSGD
ncbi:MAG: glycosyltransferase [Pseudomonadota bacterium]